MDIFSYFTKRKLKKETKINLYNRLLSVIETSNVERWDYSSEHYAKGYLATRFMHQGIVSNGGEGISYYASKQELKYAYQQQTGSYLNNIDLHNEDTGIIGGYDVEKAKIKTAEGVVITPLNPLLAIH